VFDPTIHANAIARHLQPADFIENKLLLNPAYRDAVIEKAVALGRSGFNSVSLLKNKLRDKDVYQLTDVAERLVIRHVTKNIRRLTGVKQDDRDFIIQCIRRFLEDGGKYRVYKFDVKSFYESVSSGDLVSALESDEGFSGQSACVLRSFFGELSNAGVSGLPRGLGLSATLAEYLLRSFDHHASELNEVWFYARFVDDIFIITDGSEAKKELVCSVTSALPQGLSFNSKSVAIDFEGFKKGVTGIAHVFDFLGYQFTVDRPRRRSDGKIARVVKIDIASKKVKKIKSRAAMALVRFANDANFADLHARIRLLTSNFNFVDRRSGVRRVSGIYFNYPLIDLDSSVALGELDKYLRNVLSSGHPRNKLRPKITPAQRATLTRLTFSAGYSKKHFFSFSPVQLAQLTSCWSHA
jgi:hypothetical protein